MIKIFFLKIKLLTWKTVFKLFISADSYEDQKFTDLGILWTLIHTKLIQIPSNFCAYLWDIHISKNISEVPESSYFYGMGKNSLPHAFVFLNWRYFFDISIT